MSGKIMRFIYDEPEQAIEPRESNKNVPHCPVCGDECDWIILDMGTVIGCDCCMDIKPADLAEECFPCDYDDEGY